MSKSSTQNVATGFFILLAISVPILITYEALTDLSEHDKEQIAATKLKKEHLAKLLSNAPDPVDTLPDKPVQPEIVTPDPVDVPEEKVVTPLLDEPATPPPADPIELPPIPEPIDSTPLRISKGIRYAPRTWTNALGGVTIKASILGADDISQRVKLKHEGKTYVMSWNRFSHADKLYLAQYCNDLRTRLRYEDAKQHLIAQKTLATRHALTAKANARFAANKNQAERNHAGYIHNFMYQFNPVYREGFERQRNREAYVNRGYAVGVGNRLGRWVPGYQRDDGTFQPGHWQ